MTWEAERQRAGKRLFRVCEVDLDFCQLTYGTSPCAAVLGTTGDHKCFNTRETCQDPDNYDPAAKTYRWCDGVEGIPPAFAAIPSLRGLDMAPTRIDPGRSLGKRATVTVTLQDHPHHDRGIDKYADERISGAAADDGSTYVPYEQGTYFGKLRARNPFYVGRPLRLRTGYLPWDRVRAPDQQPARTEQDVLDNLRTREYVIESMEGPDSDGTVRIVAKDVLKLAENDRAKAPSQNTGRLQSDINDSVTSATLVPSGIGNDEYAASGKLVIGSEVMDFTRSGDTLTLTRGQEGTDARAHSADDLVQECAVFTDQRVDEIIKTLLEDFAGVDSAFIPSGDWSTEATTWLPYLFSTVIAEPAGVTDLISELSEQGMCYVWWDEVAQEIKLKALIPRDASATLTDDANIIEDSLTRRDMADERLSRVVVRFGRISPVAPLEEPDNFTRSFQHVDTEAESADQYDQSRERRIYSRWITGDSDGRGQAQQVALRLVGRMRDVPTRYEFQMGAKDADVLTGDVVNLQSRLAQNERGLAHNLRGYVLEAEEVDDGLFRYLYRSEVFDGWTVPFPVGKRLAVSGGVEISALAALTSSRVAFIDAGNDELRTYDFDGTDWSQAGNSLAVSGVSSPALAALTSSRVAFIDASNEELRTYDFDGTDWSQVGNGLAVAGAGGLALAALTSSRVAFIDSFNDELRTYDFDGTDWSQVGNSLAVSDVGFPSLTALTSSRVAFIENVNDELRTYDFDGTDWSQVGNSLAVSGGVSISALAALTSSRVAFIENASDELRTYDFDGADWSQTGNGIAFAGAGTPALAALTSSRVAFIDAINDDLRAYDIMLALL